MYTLGWGLDESGWPNLFIKVSILFPLSRAAFDSPSGLTLGTAGSLAVNPLLPLPLPYPVMVSILSKSQQYKIKRASNFLVYIQGRQLLNVHTRKTTSQCTYKEDNFSVYKQERWILSVHTSWQYPHIPKHGYCTSRLAIKEKGQWN